jgi:hypothetical protein
MHRAGYATDVSRQQNRLSRLQLDRHRFRGDVRHAALEEHDLVTVAVDETLDFFRSSPFMGQGHKNSCESR